MMVSDFASEFLQLFGLVSQLHSVTTVTTQTKNAAFLGSLNFENLSSCFVHSCCFSSLLQRPHIF